MTIMSTWPRNLGAYLKAFVGGAITALSVSLAQGVFDWKSAVAAGLAALGIALTTNKEGVYES